MARLSDSFMNDTLWPEFLELQTSLAAYFDALTDRVIEQALDVRRAKPRSGVSRALPRRPQGVSWSPPTTSHPCYEAIPQAKPNGHSTGGKEMPMRHGAGP